MRGQDSFLTSPLMGRPHIDYLK